VKKAAHVGFKVLLENESALDAVEKAVNVMELDEYFNAGYGSVLTVDGRVEMDATIMCGRTLNFGSVSIVRDILYPISLARLVMKKSKHKCLSEDATTKFARANGMRILDPPGQLVTDFTSNFMQNFVNEQLTKNHHLKVEDKYVEAIGEGGTVGAVAIDSNGNIAVATSTGGIGGKMNARIGDSALIGCGTYCDNKIAGVSTTGHGDILMRACIAHDVVKRMEYLKEDVQKASENSCKRLKDDFKGTGGVIALDHDGNIGIAFNSQRMAWAYQDCVSQIHYGIKRKDDFVQEVNDADFNNDDSPF
jgi:beta-aspartyl-peptidase (threonine type)